ncbi:hypothetical protein D3C81_2149480 [compost metagenome]
MYGITGEQQQAEGDDGQPAESTIGQRHAVTHGEECQVRPWQGKHVQSLRAYGAGVFAGAQL